MAAFARLPLIVALAFSTLLVWPGRASAASPVDSLAGSYPTEMPAIGVSVIHDGLDGNGHWVQTVQLTIQPGGTLADASMVVFGDVTHVETLFQAAQRANPTLTNPAMVPVGQKIDLRIDPTTMFVLDAVLHGSNTLVQRFTNGAVNTVYLHPKGSVAAMLTFPDGTPAGSFSFPTSSGPIKVQPGGRIVDLRYAKGESFADLVGETYGVTTYSAAVDLTRQTGWESTHWPPPAGATKRVVTAAPDVYQPAPPKIAPIPNPNPAGRARQLALQQQRLKAGIYVARQDLSDTVYHVAVNDPSITASGLSRLIYGTTAHRLDVARAAGYQIPTGDSKAVANFDPHLLGRSFDLTVGYQDEQFVVSRTVDAKGVQHVALADGAQITTYPDSTHGPQEIVEYPTHYKEIIYRPSKISVMLAQGLALFHVASESDLPSSAATVVANGEAAQILWQWSPEMPREPGDIADSVQLVKTPTGSVMHILVGPPIPRSAVGGLVDKLGLQNPVIAAIELVVVGAAIIVLVDLTRRRARRRLRW